MDGMKSNPDFAAISAVLKENLDLVGSPVAVKIVTAPEQIPAGVPEIEETVRHCRMISLAREGKIFYATDAKHQCGGGGVCRIFHRRRMRRCMPRWKRQSLPRIL